jgi:guanosine-3',5'-bis(diphosphate) 3'-pyrophosphohydrolase
MTRRPISNHPIALANLLANEGGVSDPAVLTAAILHDTLEDTETTVEELARLFGDEIAAIVQEVTNDGSLPKPAQKQRQIDHAPHLSPKAKLVKLADKICNFRDILATPPADWPPERKAAYFEHGVKVVAGLRGVHAGLEGIFDASVARASKEARA